MRVELRSAPRPGPPVIVQEYVEHDAELRVYYVDGQVHGFEVGKEAAADPWLAPDRVTVRHAELPQAVVSAATTLAEGLSLRYGAFDFLVQGDRLVFLEVNPDGDWLWAERKARTAPVTLAVARMLCESAPQLPPVPGGTRQPGRWRLRPAIVPRPSERDPPQLSRRGPVSAGAAARGAAGARAEPGDDGVEFMLG